MVACTFLSAPLMVQHFFFLNTLNYLLKQFIFTFSLSRPKCWRLPTWIRNSISMIWTASCSILASSALLRLYVEILKLEFCTLEIISDFFSIVVGYWRLPRQQEVEENSPFFYSMPSYFTGKYFQANLFFRSLYNFIFTVSGMLGRLTMVHTWVLRWTMATLSPVRLHLPGCLWISNMDGPARPFTLLPSNKEPLLRPKPSPILCSDRLGCSSYHRCCIAFYSPRRDGSRSQSGSQLPVRTDSGGSRSCRSHFFLFGYYKMLI